MESIHKEFQKQINNRAKEINDFQKNETTLINLKYKDDKEKCKDKILELNRTCERKRMILSRCSVSCSCNKILRFKNWYNHTKEPKSHMNSILSLTLRDSVIPTTLIFYNDD